MNIGVYQDHAFLITNLQKVTNRYACAEYQARFTQVGSLRRRAAVCTREATKVVCRGEKIWSPETAFGKAFYGMGAYPEVTLKMLSLP